MNVKSAAKTSTLLQLLAFVLLLNQTRALIQCNVPLMKFFGLAPNKFPMKMPMRICKNIEGNCCSLVDEVRIYTLWLEFSRDKIKRHVSGIARSYQLILDSHQKLLDVDINKAAFGRTSLELIPYDFEVCERLTFLTDLMAPEANKVDLLNHNKILDIDGFDSRKLQRGELNLGKDLSKYRSPSKEDGLSLDSLSDRNLKQEGVVKVVKNSSKSRARKLRKTKAKVDSANSELVEQMDSSAENLLQKTNANNISEDSLSNSAEASENQVSLENLTTADVLKQIGGRSSDSKMGKAIKRKLSKKRLVLKRKFVFEEELPDRKVVCSKHTKMIRKRVTTINTFKKKYCYDVREKLRVFRVDDFYDYLVDIKVVMLRIIEMKRSFYCALCDVDLQKYVDPAKRVIVYNEGFCRSLIVDFRDYIKFKNIIFIQYADLMLQYIRCFQTTAEEKIFPDTSMLESFKNRFQVIQNCFDNVHGEKFMEHCRILCDQFSYTSFSSFFDGDAEFLSRIVMTIKSLFRKIDANQALTIDFVGQEKLNGKLNNLNFNDPFYAKKPGEEKDVHHVNSASSKSISIIKNADVEPTLDIQFDRIHRNKEIADKINSVEVEPQDIIQVREIENQSIYSRRQQSDIARKFVSRFVGDFAGINPIELDRQMTFAIDPETIIKDQCTQSGMKENQLDHDVVLDYFGFNKEEINAFKNDISMPFSDYALFESDDKDTVEADVINVDNRSNL